MSLFTLILTIYSLFGFILLLLHLLILTEPTFVLIIMMQLMYRLLCIIIVVPFYFKDELCIKLIITLSFVYFIL